MISKVYFSTICVLCFSNTLLAVEEFPDYYHINFTHPEFQRFAGYYKKEDKGEKNKPTFKMPMLFNHLTSVKEDGDRKWMVKGLNGIRI